MTNSQSSTYNNAAEKIRVGEVVFGLGIIAAPVREWGVIVVDDTPMGDGETWLTWSQIRQLYELGQQRGQI